MMKRNYMYPSRFLWDRDAWDCRLSPVQTLARWMAHEGLLRVTPKEDDVQLSKNAQLDVRIGARLCPEDRAYWQSRGMQLDFGHAGERWITLVPQAVIRQEEHDPITLFVLTDFPADNELWAQRFLRHYSPYFEMAAQENWMLCFVNSIPSRVDLCILILREIAQRYNVNHSRFYMDLSALYKNGRKLEEVPDFRYKNTAGDIMVHPDSAIETLGALRLPVINISGQWVSNDSLEFANFTPGRIGHLPFDYNRLTSSLAGEKMADAMRLEFDYDSAEDPGLQAHLEQMGLQYSYHEMNNRGWVCLTPQNAEGGSDNKLPCMLILQEICKSDPHSIPSAFSLWYEYLNLAAMGEMMLIFFVLEDVDSNELLADILKEAMVRYPFLDRTRVFITGHSHNGHYASAFARRHPELIAGVGTMGNPHGLSFNRDTVKLTPEEIGDLNKMEFAWINIDGQWENGFSCKELQPGERKYLAPSERVTYYQNRLKAFRCALRTEEEILNAVYSQNRAIRMLGVPVDHAEIQYVDGDECYIGDLVSLDNRNVLRLVTIENLPHATSSHMPWLTWNFLRRFSKDPETGKLMEN